MRNVVKAETADLGQVIIEQENERCDGGGAQEGASDARLGGSTGDRTQSHFIFFGLRAQAHRQEREKRGPPDDEIDGYSRNQRHDYTSSSSISVPLKSLGWRNRTGLPCAPVFGSPSPRMRAPSAFRRSRAAMMSVTS